MILGTSKPRYRDVYIDPVFFAPRAVLSVAAEQGALVTAALEFFRMACCCRGFSC